MSGDPAGAGLSRRRFLLGTALAAAAPVMAAACSRDDDGNQGVGGDTGGAAGGPTGDVGLAEFAAGLEVLAVGTYTALLDAAEAGTLGEVPPALAELVRTAAAHHGEHLAAWNKVVAGAGRPEVATPDPQLKPAVDAQLGQAKTVADAIELARGLEEAAAATYLGAVPNLKSRDAVGLAASIQAVDAEHAAVLSFLLGDYPAPDVFAKTEKAARA